MRSSWLLPTVVMLLLVGGCSNSRPARRSGADDAGRRPQASAPDASRSFDAAVRGADSGSTSARDSGVPDEGVPDADQQDASTPNVPPALRSFAEDVRRASEQGQAVGGPVNCAAPLPAVEVSSPTDAASAVREYVAAMLGVPVSELREDAQECGDASHTTCANAFNLFSGSFGGRLPETVYPLAQELDSDATSQTLTTFTTADSGSIKVVVISAVEDGWLIGIAVFGNRADCGFSD